jgi:radical SAM superfamily enzyme YgiQ (UPF0313 family)
MMIRNQFGFRWISYLRCVNLDAEAVQLAAENGCIGAMLGIESGNAEVLRNMNKQASPEKYVTAIRQLEAAGIMTWALSFIGFPGETSSSAQDTLNLIKTAMPTFFGVQMWLMDPTTPVQKRAVEFGVKGRDYAWRHNSMTWQEAASWTETVIR